MAVGPSRAELRTPYPIMFNAAGCEQHARPGKSRPDQDAAQQRAEHLAGLEKFDPDAVTVVLKCGLFHHYLHLCLFIESLPPQLAGFAEQCPCHSALTRHLNSYQKEQLFTAHYGTGVTSCPLAGMMAPELVAGLACNSTKS
jgi:hypothetical protein